MKIVTTDASAIIKSATEKYISLLAPTYGPAGKSVLLGNAFSVQAVDDGKLVAQDIELENELENDVIKYIKEVTEKTDNRVGDGTTTAALIMADIVLETLKNDNPFLSTNRHELVKELKKGLKEAVAHITKSSKKIKTKEELYSIAYNSFNNEDIARLISETVFSVGKDGVIAVEDSQSVRTESEVVQGLEIEKGYASPYFITNNGEAILKNPVIALVNQRIESFREIFPFIKGLVESGNTNFVIIAEGFGDDAMANIIVNKARGMFNALLIETPGFGDQKIEYLKDIASVVGGTIVDKKTATTFETAVCGKATSVLSKKDKTTILGGLGDSKKRIRELQIQLEQTQSRFDKNKLEKRIAQISGGIAVIRVGADTENEQKTIKAKVDDAVSATKAALENGIVLGAGKTLMGITTSSEILNHALKAPRKQLEENGKESLDDKVYDPAGVLIAALESAVSIASGLLEMSGIISIKREEKKNDY